MKITFVIIALFLAFSGRSQEGNTKMVSAFADSYKFETAGKYSDAVKSLKSVYIETSYEVNLRLGWLTYLQGQLNESVNYYTKAIALMPYAIEPRLGIAYPASAQGNWDLVVTQYKAILGIDPNNTLTLYRLGLIHYERKEFKQAAEHFEKVVNLYPFDYDSVIMLAWSNFQIGKTREAKVLFQKAQLYNPSSESAREGLQLIK